MAEWLPAGAADTPCASGDLGARSTAQTVVEPSS